MKFVARFSKWRWVVATVALMVVASCAGLDEPIHNDPRAVGGSPAYPLQRGPAGARYVVDQNDVPFLWSGDTAWSLIAQLTESEANLYLDDRQAKGFNVVLVNLLEHRFATRAPANIAGDPPFVQQPFASPNETYFAHADNVIRAAEARGITVLLAPLYLGWHCGGEGWCSEVAHATEAEMYAWGRYVGARYRDFDNLVWLIGGDADPTPVRSKVLAMVRGIREVDARHLITAHNDVTTGRSRWRDQDWLAIDNVYSYNNALFEDDRAVYAAAPAMPYFLIESKYEHEFGVSAQHLRAQAYWTLLSGGMGHIFGNCPIWHFGAAPNWCGTSDWKANLSDRGSIGMMHLTELFRSRPWHTLVPDFGSKVITNGQLSGAEHAAAARTADGGTVIAYLPSPRPITIDMTQVSGTHATAWWYSPAFGTAEKLGTYLTSGSRTFSPPNGDSVLVIDDQSRGYPTPGMIGNDKPIVQPPPTEGIPPITSTDVVVDFERSPEEVALTDEGGIAWPRSGVVWRVWNGYSKYSKNAYIDSKARTEVTATFTLPTAALLKSLRIAVGSGARAASVKISSPGNAERVYTDISGTYVTKYLDWSTPASTITVKVTCDTIYGASDLAFDTITYAPAANRSLPLAYSE